MTRKKKHLPADTLPIAANDNLPPISKEAETAILRIARVIGRQMAREEMARRRAERANDEA